MDKAASQSCTSGRVTRLEPPPNGSDLCGRAGDVCRTTPLPCSVTQTHACTQTHVKTFTLSDKQGIDFCLRGIFYVTFFLLGIDTLFLHPPVVHGDQCGRVCVCVCVNVGLQLCVCVCVCVCAVNNRIHLVMVPLKSRVVIHSKIHFLFPDMCIRTTAAKKNLCQHFPSIQFCLRGSPECLLTKHTCIL